MNTGRDPTSRLRANLNPLRTTALGGGFHGANVTPLSAISIAQTQTPASAIQPYNPQQWAPSPAPERLHYQDPQRESSSCQTYISASFTLHQLT
jgi:hypothetical protein